MVVFGDGVLDPMPRVHVAVEGQPDLIRYLAQARAALLIAPVSRLGDNFAEIDLALASAELGDRPFHHAGWTHLWRSRRGRKRRRRCTWENRFHEGLALRVHVFLDSLLHLYGRAVWIWGGQGGRKSCRRGLGGGDGLSGLGGGDGLCRGCWKRCRHHHAMLVLLRDCVIVPRKEVAVERHRHMTRNLPDARAILVMPRVLCSDDLAKRSLALGAGEIFDRLLQR